MQDYVDFMKKVWADKALKQAYMANPKKVLKEQGIKVDDKVELVVYENTPKKLYIQLEPKPDNVDEWAKQTAQVRAAKCASKPCRNWNEIC